jgi:hypothetical protein
LTYTLRADEIEEESSIVYYGKLCKVVGVHTQSYPEIGFTLLENGDSSPKMFHMTADRAEMLQVSLSSLLKKL